MISVTKDFTKPPASLLSDKCQSKIKESIEKASYQKSNWYKRKDTKKALKEIYNNKCAYCEGYSSAQAPFHVEHYRPKKEASITVDDKKIKIEGHKGYYWLAFEWSNLLWSCYWCNKNKDTQFPLEDEKNRKFNPPLDKGGKLKVNNCRCNNAELLSEKPLLINPEIDNPEDHFYFLPNGDIKSLSEIGKATIRICELDREDLCRARKKLVNKFYKNIRTKVTAHLSGEVDLSNFERNIKDILTEIYKRTEPENDYSRLSHFMIKKFKYFFLKKSDFNDDTKGKLLKIYEEFLSKVMA